MKTKCVTAALNNKLLEYIQQNPINPNMKII